MPGASQDGNWDEVWGGSLGDQVPDPAPGAGIRAAAEGGTILSFTLATPSVKATISHRKTSLDPLESTQVFQNNHSWTYGESKERTQLGPRTSDADARASVSGLQSR